MDENKITCTLCHGVETIPIHNKIRNITDDSSKMYECVSCKTHFLYPQPKGEQLEDYYNGQFREEVHTSFYYNEAELTNVFERFSPEAQLRVSRVDHELSSTDEILEIGCSVGYFLKAAVNKVQIAYGTEWDSRARAYINDVINDTRIKTSKNPQEFSKKFDKIFMFHVLEHIVDPIQFLIDLKPLLKEKGKIYIEVPNVDDITSIFTI